MTGAFSTRMLAFAGGFALLFAWELVARRRRFELPRAWRWSHNVGLHATGALVLTALSAFGPLLAFQFAFYAETQGWGLLHQTRWPYPLKFAIAILALDLVVFLQHWLFHKVPWLWRFHRVHHLDLELDLTTGLRFHPGEILLSLAIKLAAISLIGAHFLAVIVFEVLLNFFSMFTHANARVPLERLLRLVFVTPEMHRVHHSVRPGETNSNYGFQLSLWDRLLGTYEPEPADGHLDMKLGLPEQREPREQSLPRLLLLPFLGFSSAAMAEPRR